MLLIRADSDEKVPAPKIIMMSKCIAELEYHYEWGSNLKCDTA